MQDHELPPNPMHFKRSLKRNPRFGVYRSSSHSLVVTPSAGQSILRETESPQLSLHLSRPPFPSLHLSLPPSLPLSLSPSLSLPPSLSPPLSLSLPPWPAYLSIALASRTYISDWASTIEQLDRPLLSSILSQPTRFPAYVVYEINPRS